MCDVFHAVRLARVDVKLVQGDDVRVVLHLEGGARQVLLQVVAGNEVKGKRTRGKKEEEEKRKNIVMVKEEEKRERGKKKRGGGGRKEGKKKERKKREGKMGEGEEK